MRAAAIFGCVSFFCAFARAQSVSTGTPRAAAPSTAAKWTPPRSRPYWLKTYNLTPHRVTWTVTLSLRDFDRDAGRVAALVVENGGVLAAKPSGFVSDRRAKQSQLVFSAPHARAERALKKLGALGRVSRPVVGVVGEAIPEAEVARKIDRLLKERTEHAAELRKMPQIRAAVDEILESLFRAQQAAQDDERTVRVDLLVRQL